MPYVVRRTRNADDSTTTEKYYTASQNSKSKSLRKLRRLVNGNFNGSEYATLNFDYVK